MKSLLRSIFLLPVLVFLTGQAIAQCTPDPLVVDLEGNGEMSPDTLIAYEGTPLNLTLTIIAPDTASVPPSGHIDLDHIHIRSLQNAPGWIAYACDNGNCDYAAGVKQCALVTGTPPSGSAGVYTITVLVDVYTLILSQPVCITCALYPNGYDSGMPLIMYVYPAQSVEEFGDSGFGILGSTPNPFTESTKLGCYTKTPDKVTLSVYDIIGNIVYKEVLQTNSGENFFRFTGTDLNAGIYMYSVTNSSNESITRKMVKSE